MLNKVVFLDRDGTLNSNSSNYYIYKEEDLFINEGVIDGLKILLKAKYKLVIITNQGGISKGVYEHINVNKVNNKLLKILEESGVTIDGVYFCPHHDSLENCLCRKPKTLLLEKAVYLHHADITRSYFIGDSETDIKCSELIGVKGIKIYQDENIVPYCKAIVSEETL